MNNTLTEEQLEDLNTSAHQMQQEGEACQDRNAAAIAYATQVAIMELRMARAAVAELKARCAVLAAENAALKAGIKYFSYSEMSGFEEHGTAELAMKSADADLAGERDEASSEGWSEETDTICWGVIVQKAVEDKFEKPSEENGFTGWSDYTLLPVVKTPATDAFLAEIRAQGVEMFAERKNKELFSLHPDTHAIGSIAAAMSAEVKELHKFAAQLRQEAAQ
jgi:hypothetical protein